MLSSLGEGWQDQLTMAADSAGRGDDDDEDDDGDDDDNSDHNLTMSNHLKILALNCPISFFVQQSDFPITGMMFT